MDAAAVMGAIRGMGLKATPQRMAVAEYMNGVSGHPSAEDVHREIKKTHPTVSLSTVYKTLDLLRERGMVSEVSTGTGSRYEGRGALHVNLVCERCGRIDDLEGEFVHELLRRVSESTEYEIRGSPQVKGVCGRCRAIR